MRTFVRLCAPDAWPDDGDVLALDLDVREASSDEALAAARDAASRSISRLFVKIDSTLRGPIDALISGALHGSGLAKAIVAPAFPEQGRLLQHGRLVLSGAAAPAPDLVKVLDAELVAAEAARTPETLDTAIAATSASRIVIDADGPACLESVAAVWARHPDWMLVGSSGLARRIADGPPSTASELTRADGTLLIVAGSPAEATHRQLARLRGMYNVEVIATKPAQQRDDGSAARALGAQVEALSASKRPCGVVLVGGQTARHVCQRLRVTSIRLSGELEPGIAYGRLIGGIWNDLPVVTKAGGFGGPDALLDVVRAFGVSSVAGEPT